METIPFVRKEHAETARLIEKKLLELHPSTGIVFASVDITPTKAEEDPVFRLLVGTDREKKLEGAIGPLVTMALGQELLQGIDIKVEVRRGIHRG
jgi:hypothetical protein